MTMSRKDKVEAEKVLKGVVTQDFASPKNRAMCRAEGRDGYAMTPAEYAREYLHRGDSRGLAQEKKIVKQGGRVTESGKIMKVTRKGR